MSAETVGHDHIDALLTFFNSYVEDPAKKPNLTTIGRILLTENARSVNHRYAGKRAASARLRKARRYKFTAWSRVPTAAEIVAACDYLDYHSSEHDEWSASVAKKILTTIRAVALSRATDKSPAPAMLELTRARHENKPAAE